MNGLWQMWEAGVDDKSVEQINTLAERFPLQEGITGHNLDPNFGKNEKVRTSKIRWIDKKHPDSIALVQMLHRLFEQANNGTLFLMKFVIYQFKHKESWFKLYKTKVFTNLVQIKKLM